MSEEYTDYIFKALAIGDGGCGKTALCVQFAQGFFQENYKLTIGVEFFVKTIKVKNYSVKLQIWDTGGQERFAYVRPMYYKGALGAILLFDITNRESFEHLAKWIEEVNANVGQKIPLLLVGNKADLVDERKVTREEAKAFAQEHDMYYMESSAKTAFGVHDVFGVLALLMIGEEIPSEMLCQEVTAPCKDKEKPKVEEELPTFEEYQEFAEEKPIFEANITPSFNQISKPSVNPPPVVAKDSTPSFNTVEPAFKPVSQPSLSPAPAFKPAPQPSLSRAPAFKPTPQPSLSTASEKFSEVESSSIETKKIEIHKKPIVIDNKEPTFQTNAKPSFLEQTGSVSKPVKPESDIFAPPVPERIKPKPSLKPIASPTSNKISSEYFASAVPEKPKAQTAELDPNALFGPSEEEEIDDELFAPPVPEKKPIKPYVVVFDEVQADPDALQKGIKPETKTAPVSQKKIVPIEAFKPKSTYNTGLFNPLAPENSAAKEKKADSGVNPFILPSSSKDKDKSAASNPFFQPSKPFVASSQTIPEAKTLSIPTAKTLQTENKPLDKKARKELEKQEKERIKREQEERKKREKELKKRKLRECPQCKAELPEKFKFCNKCGAKL